jgi:hypothetical protein
MPVLLLNLKQTKVAVFGPEKQTKEIVLPKNSRIFDQQSFSSEYVIIILLSN